MPLLTVEQVKEHIETDVPDTALQRLLVDAEASVVTLYGVSDGSVSERVAGGSRFLFPTFPIDTSGPVTVTEVDGPTETELSANDWREWYGGRMLERIPYGDHPRSRWSLQVVIVSTPQAAIAQRTAMVIDLVKLELAYSGYASEAIGDSRLTALDYQKARGAILSRLPHGKMLA